MNTKNVSRLLVFLLIILMMLSMAFLVIRNRSLKNRSNHEYQTYLQNHQLETSVKTLKSKNLKLKLEREILWSYADKPLDKLLLIRNDDTETMFGKCQEPLLVLFYDKGTCLSCFNAHFDALKQRRSSFNNLYIVTNSNNHKETRIFLDSQGLKDEAFRGAGILENISDRISSPYLFVYRPDFPFLSNFFVLDKDNVLETLEYLKSVTTKI